jgi:hypothetical protein
MTSQWVAANGTEVEREGRLGAWERAIYTKGARASAPVHLPKSAPRMSPELRARLDAQVIERPGAAHQDSLEDVFQSPMGRLLEVIYEPERCEGCGLDLPKGSLDTHCGACLWAAA